MPPAKKAAAKAKTDLCVECFPGGWDAMRADAYSAGCAHGSWHHPERLAALQAQSEPDEIEREPAQL